MTAKSNHPLEKEDPVHHHLKTEKGFFEDVLSGKKKFELRINDRDFRVGDIVHLIEVKNGKATDREIVGLVIDYILKDKPEYGLKPGYCIFSWREVDPVAVRKERSAGKENWERFKKEYLRIY